MSAREWEIRKFNVDRYKSKWVTEEPIIGKWYVGANMETGGAFVCGELSEYVGDGIFIDDYGMSCDMNEYQYLIEQASECVSKSFDGDES